MKVENLSHNVVTGYNFTHLLYFNVTMGFAFDKPLQIYTDNIPTSIFTHSRYTNMH